MGMREAEAKRARGESIHWPRGRDATSNVARRDLVARAAAQLEERVEDFVLSRDWDAYNRQRGVCKLLACRRSKLCT